MRAMYLIFRARYNHLIARIERLERQNQILAASHESICKALQAQHQCITSAYAAIQSQQSMIHALAEILGCTVSDRASVEDKPTIH